MSSGAYRLLDLFRWHWRKFGPEGCWPKLRALALRFQVTTRTVRRWVSELRLKSCVKVILRGRLGALFLPPDVLDNVLDSGRPSLYELEEVNKTMLSENLPVENKTQSQTPESHANETGFSPTEKQAVADAVESHRRPDGSGFVCSPGLVRRLERIALFYGANGFQAAAELERVRRTDLESRSRWPERDAWFCVVLESRLKRREAKSMGREERSGAVFLGWSAEEIAAIEQQAADGAAETLAQPEKPKRTPDTPKPAVAAQSEEYCDTREMLARILDARRWPAA